MWVTRKRWNRLVGRIDSAERRLDTLTKFAHNDFNKLKADNNRIENLQKTVGESKSSLSIFDKFYRHAIWSFMGDDEKREELPVDLTVWQSIEKIMDAVGLEVKDVSGRKPEKKIVKRAVKAIKKGKK